MSTAIASSTTFRTGSPLHAVCLLICLVLVTALCLAGRQAVAQNNSTAKARLSRLTGYGGLVTWFINTCFWMLPGRFAWESSLPLHFCNLANLIGALAILGSARFWKTLLYFWTPTLCLWAFLTPTLHGGYATSEFWIFWVYHLFILLAWAEVLVVQQYRPLLPDLRQAWVITVAYVILLAVPDLLFGWNYGFVGPSVPDAPTPIDVLGPYPQRLLHMILIGTVLYLLLWLPWRKRR
jgi:hypothetical integral membrane protein (TIGR02206 family)